MDSVNFKEAQALTKKLISFIKRSPTAYHAVDNIKNILKESGVLPLSEADDQKIAFGQSYFITRNMSSLIAFTIPENPKGFMICASHSDSPCFKLKPDFQKKAAGGFITLDCEKYGGMINSSWLDRPLSVAGRIAVKGEHGIEMKLVNIDRDLLVIPNVCIHFNRSVNDGFKYNAQNDLSPLYATGSDSTKLMELVAKQAKVKKKNIISHDLFVYDRTAGTVWGADGEFFSSPRIDNLQCAYATLDGFMSSTNDSCIKVYALFDNEETGSSTRQGAASTFLFDTLVRICESLGISQTEYRRMLCSSFMLSADNAHALHPAHPELYDPLNAPVMNKGVVIKFNAAQRYTTDALSGALFKQICERAGVPTQSFANRSDVAGGSTLGNISNNSVALPTADIGLSQLAMHSAYESAGCLDTWHMCRAVSEFYKSFVRCTNDSTYSLE